MFVAKVKCAWESTTYLLLLGDWSKKSNSAPYLKVRSSNLTRHILVSEGLFMNVSLVFMELTNKDVWLSDNMNVFIAATEKHPPVSNAEVSIIFAALLTLYILLEINEMMPNH